MHTIKPIGSGSKIVSDNVVFGASVELEVLRVALTCHDGVNAAVHMALHRMSERAGQRLD